MKKLTFIPLLLLLLSSAKAQNCTAYFSIVQDGNSAYFTNLSTPYDSATQFVWSFGDGTSSNENSPTHYYNNMGMQLVCLYMLNSSGCTDSYCDSLFIDSSNTSTCSASFTFQQNGKQLTFTNTSASSGSGSLNYSWSFGDGSTSSEASPVHEYAENGTYLICLQISTFLGCSDMYCVYVTIADSACWVSFTHLVDGSTVQFFSSTASGGNGQYIWNFGDGQISNESNPVHNYAAAGFYNVCLQYTDSSCSTMICDSFDVGAGDSCYADFVAWQSYSTVQFSSFNYDLTKQYVWSFGDGTAAYGPYVSHEYQEEAVYLVCLTVSDSFCTATTCQSIWYTPDSILNNGGTCEAAFEVALIDTTNDTVWLTDLSTGANTYLWDFGDGTTSTVQYPSHTYSQNGLYEVCLTILCDSNTMSFHCEWVGMMDSLTNGGYDDTRSGFVLNVKPQTISSVNPTPANESIHLFPNPSADVIHFKLPAAAGGQVNILLFNTVGQVVSRQSITVNSGVNALDISSLKSGMYLLQVMDGNKLFTGSFIRQ